MTGERAAEVELFLKGAPWPPVDRIAYPRADPADARRLPADTWAAAGLPAGVRLEFEGEADQVEIGYECLTDDLGHRGAGAGTAFALWRDGAPVDQAEAHPGSGRARLRLGTSSGRAIVYLPEGMRPVVTSLEAIGGAIRPAAPQPRWIAYGDSITEGWNASSPALTWVATAARERSLDVLNLGYAGSARGEIPSAEQIASLGADVITLGYGTNCWSMVPYSEDMMRANVKAFVHILRSAQPGVPVVVVSPIVRPDAEDRPNRLGATLAALRLALEQEAAGLEGDGVTLVPGRDLVAPDLLDDGIHPGDAGHRALAEAIGAVLAEVLG